jgi:hypothetical protein
MLDVQLFGLNPAGHHLTSVLFHIANSPIQDREWHYDLLSERHSVGHRQQQ